MEYELRDDDVQAARLIFRNSLSTLAIAESADGLWFFKRVGFWQNRTIIRDANTDQELGLFNNNTWKGGGTLEVPGERIYYAGTNFWTTHYDFSTETGEVCIEFQNIGGMVHLSSEVSIHPLAKEIPELPWMVILGWYLTIMMHMDSIAGTTAVP